MIRMCGICGYIGFRDDTLIKRMTKILRHRGPDNVGYYLDADVTLGHTRLSIVDLSESGNQPMFNEDGTLVLVFNGEIYNQKEIRHDLENKGHIFKSQSDSEVILHAYEEHGTESLPRFNGMFAFALWDSRQKTLLLARDRLGIKQVYYSFHNGILIFASEIKAILETDSQKRELNDESLIDYITFENIIGSKTFFKNINILEPGHYLLYKDNRIQLKQYWDVEFNPNFEISISERLHQFREVIRQSVYNHLMSDVPLGCYLSGGFDSTSVTTIASELLNEPVLTFTGKFDAGKLYDEGPCANAVAEKVKSTHHLITITPQDFLDNIQDIIYYLDEPKVGPGSFSQYMVAKRAAETVKVILTGHGGDELFCGYPVHKALFVEKVIKEQWARVFNLGRYLKKSEFPFFVYFALFSIWKPQIKWGLPVIFHKKEWKELFTPEYYSQIGNLDTNSSIENVLNGKQYDDLGKLQYLYLKTYLPSLFVVEDKIGMAHSLESRTPICDNEMVDFALSIPIEQKLHNNQLKYIVKEGMKEKLPPILYNQRKKGFPTPISKWFRQDLKEFLKATLLCEKVGNRGIFNLEYISSLLDKHFRTRFETPFSEIRAHKIWMLLNIELWFRIFIDGNYGKT